MVRMTERVTAEMSVNLSLLQAYPMSTIRPTSSSFCLFSVLMIAAVYLRQAFMIYEKGREEGRSEGGFLSFELKLVAKSAKFFLFLRRNPRLMSS